MTSAALPRGYKLGRIAKAFIDADALIALASKPNPGSG